MISNDFLFRLTRVLFALAIVSTTYLYLYPIWLTCAFPATDRSRTTAFWNTVQQHRDANSEADRSLLDSLAPFRLLVLADPQLEGDSSLPKPKDALLAKLHYHWKLVTNVSIEDTPYIALEAVKEIVTQDIPREVKGWRKRLDLLGNDYYLAHIFRILHWWTVPTHVTILGDLIGSQWVDDDEFKYRGWRFWNRVFAGGHKVDEEIMNAYHNDNGQYLQNMDAPEWRRKIINIAGNHDIGYAGDISQSRMERFEETFGKANWDVRFSYPSNVTAELQPSIHLVVLNSMLLDTPALDEELQSQTYAYLNSVVGRARPVEDRTSFVLFLTHVPLHKEAGICVDAPFFDFFPDDENCNERCRPSGLKEQYHLSPHASFAGTLETMFGMSGNKEAAAQGRGRPGLILNGHDHEGCDVFHYVPQDNTTVTVEETGDSKTNWQAARWKESGHVSAHTGIREVTLRSMMGEFGGNAGLLSAWFDFATNEWQYDIAMCRIGIQHIWWAVHIVDIITVSLICLNLSLWIFGIDLAKYHSASVTKPKLTKID